jgi:hypothetical protein
VVTETGLLSVFGQIERRDHTVLPMTSPELLYFLGVAFRSLYVLYQVLQLRTCGSVRSDIISLTFIAFLIVDEGESGVSRSSTLVLPKRKLEINFSVDANFSLEQLFTCLLLH